MRVLRAMLVLLPWLSFAGWRPVGTVGTPVADVMLADAGVVLAVSSSTGSIAWNVSDGGSTTLNTLVGNFVGGGYFGANCLLGLTASGSVTPSGGCGTVTSLGAGIWQSFKLLSAAPRAVAVSSSGSFDSLRSGPGAGSPWVTRNINVLANGDRSLQTRTIGGVDYTAMNTGLGLRMSVDGGVASVVVNSNGWRDAAPFPLEGRPAVLGVTSASLVLFRDYRAPVLITPSTPAGVSPRYVGISGVAAMVTTTTGVLLSPIPDPARKFELWVLRPRPANEGFTDKVHCLDDRCVTSNDAGVVWLWKNELAPTISVMVPQLDAGQTIRLFADAGDLDGDPIYVAWDVAWDGGLGGTLRSVVGVSDGTQVDFTAPVGTCTPITIDATVTDGLPGHERSISIPVTVIDRGQLQVERSGRALVSLIDGTSQPSLAGGPPISFFAFIDGGCAQGALAWSTSDGQSGGGPNFSWTPPQTECNSGGGQVTVTTTATWMDGVPATTSVVGVVSIKPWGAPTAPVFSSGTQQGGTSVDWVSSGVSHACNAATGFPGTELIWDGIDAGLAMATVIDGGLRIFAPLSCSAQQVSATARRQVIGEDAGRVSAPATLVVDIPSVAAPLNASTAFFLSVAADAGVLFGLLAVDAGCAEPSSLSARVSVSSGGNFVVEGDFAAQGPWSLPLPGGCSGGTYELVAQLFEDGGFTGAGAQGSISLPFSPVRIGAQSVDKLPVVCGVGARGAVALVPEPNACGAADVGWRAIGGPPLIAAEGRGEVFELQSQALDFSIVGQQVTVEWSADAGPGNSGVRSQSIELGVEPFLEVSVRARLPLRREEDAVEFEVTLRNTTACAVGGLVVTLPLTGGSPLLESVLLDGVRIAARATEGGITVAGVTVPAAGVATLRLAARARLLSSPTVDPVALLRGYVVSTRPASVAAPTGCGCGTAEASMSLGLLVVLGWRRRRA